MRSAATGLRGPEVKRLFIEENVKAWVLKLVRNVLQGCGLQGLSALSDGFGCLRAVAGCGPGGASFSLL